MLEEGDIDIKDLLKLKYEIDFHVAIYFEYLSTNQTKRVLEGETAAELNRGVEGKERLKNRKARFDNMPKKHGTIKVTGLPVDGLHSEGDYVLDLFERYSHVEQIRLQCKKNKKWIGSAIILLEDLDVKDKLIKEGLYLSDRKRYSGVEIVHHQKIEWNEDDV